MEEEKTTNEINGSSNICSKSGAVLFTHQGNGSELQFQLKLKEGKKNKLMKLSKHKEKKVNRTSLRNG